MSGQRGITGYVANVYLLNDNLEAKCITVNVPFLFRFEKKDRHSSTLT